MQNTIILLLEQIVSALGTEFKIYLPQVVPQVLKVFMHDNSPQRSITSKVSVVAPRSQFLNLTVDLCVCVCVCVRACVFSFQALLSETNTVWPLCHFRVLSSCYQVLAILLHSIPSSTVSSISANSNCLFLSHNPSSGVLFSCFVSSSALSRIPFYTLLIKC